MGGFLQHKDGAGMSGSEAAVVKHCLILRRKAKQPQRISDMGAAFAQTLCQIFLSIRIRVDQLPIGRASSQWH